ncbi:MAG: SirB2 family protein [Gammaproteobacteria bacterium]
MSYGLIKYLHIGSAVLSLGLFVLRGGWMLYAPQRLQVLWVRVLPHVIDTVLLVSALTLVFMSRQYPGQAPWLTAKVVALLVYIGLGTLALKRGRSRGIRVLAWFAALAVFGYIVMVAVTRSVWW